MALWSVNVLTNWSILFRCTRELPMHESWMNFTVFLYIMRLNSTNYMDTLARPCNNMTSNQDQWFRQIIDIDLRFCSGTFIHLTGPEISTRAVSVSGFKMYDMLGFLNDLEVRISNQTRSRDYLIFVHDRQKYAFDNSWRDKKARTLFGFKFRADDLMQSSVQDTIL